MKYLRLFGLFAVIIIATSVFVAIEVFITNHFNLPPEIVGFCGYPFGSALGIFTLIKAVDIWEQY